MRVIHEPSGARGESREERSQLQNKKAAFLRMLETPQFKRWLAIETGRIAMVEAEAERIHVPDSDIKVEVKRDGRWVVVPADQLQA